MNVIHNRKTATRVGPIAGPDRKGIICILASDGRLFGPFNSRGAAIYWCASQDINAFSTYDLLAPNDPNQRPPID